MFKYDENRDYKNELSWYILRRFRLGGYISAAVAILVIAIILKLLAGENLSLDGLQNLINMAK